MDGNTETNGLEQTPQSVLATREALAFDMACREAPAMMTASLLHLFPDLVALFEEIKRLQGMLAEMRTLALDASKEFQELINAIHRDTDDLGNRFSILRDRFDKAAKVAASLPPAPQNGPVQTKGATK